MGVHEESLEQDEIEQFVSNLNARYGGVPLTLTSGAVKSLRLALDAALAGHVGESVGDCPKCDLVVGVLGLKRSE